MQRKACLKICVTVRRLVQDVSMVHWFYLSETDLFESATERLKGWVKCLQDKMDGERAFINSILMKSMSVFFFCVCVCVHSWPLNSQNPAWKRICSISSNEFRTDLLSSIFGINSWVHMLCRVISLCVFYVLFLLSRVINVNNSLLRD